MLSIIRLKAAALAVLLGLSATAPALAEGLELLMVEEKGCVYCARWNAEIGPEYPITPEGKAAPLRRIDIGDQPFAGLTLDRRVVFTPTFVLLQDGTEVGRLEGFISEDFFWGLLGNMIASAQPQTGG